MPNRRKSLVLGVWAASILVVSVGELLPGGSAPLRWVAATGFSDKTFHFAAYLLLASIPMSGLDRRSGISGALAMVGLGIALDCAQTWIPGRTFELADILANTIGVAIGVVTGFVVTRLRTVLADA